MAHNTFWAYRKYGNGAHKLAIIDMKGIDRTKISETFRGTFLDNIGIAIAKHHKCDATAITDVIEQDITDICPSDLLGAELVDFDPFTLHNLTFVKAYHSDHTGGGCMVDVLRLEDGKVITINDEVLTVWRSVSDFEYGFGYREDEAKTWEDVEPYTHSIYLYDEENRAGGICGYLSSKSTRATAHTSEDGESIHIKIDGTRRTMEIVASEKEITFK